MGKSILSKIINHKKLEIAGLKKRFSSNEIKNLAMQSPQPADFVSALITGKQPRVIAEIKKASPSKGVLTENFDPLLIAAQYQQNGAAAVSVLTDERFFQGNLSYLSGVKKKISLPVLRKDFLIDQWQVYESRAAGADTVLLIAAIMEGVNQLSELLGLSRSLGMEPLVEVHKEAEVEMALEAGSRIIGINNRNLENFKVDLSVSQRLAPKIGKDKVIVAESGINSSENMHFLSQSGVHAFLIGEVLMKSSNPGESLSAISGGWNR